MSDTGMSHPDAVDGYVDATYGAANSCMSDVDRAESVMAAVNAQLAVEGVPYVGYDWEAGDNAGQFHFRTWTMGLGRGAFDPAVYEQTGAAGEADLLDTVYHEARHSEQWYRMARERAGLGATVQQIVEVMHIPDWVAEYAAQNPINQCDESQYEAEQWYRSVYGEGRQHRNDVLNDTENRYDDYRQLPEESDAWETGGQVTQEYLDRGQE